MIYRGMEWNLKVFRVVFIVKEGFVGSLIEKI